MDKTDHYSIGQNHNEDLSKIISNSASKVNEIQIKFEKLDEFDKKEENIRMTPNKFIKISPQHQITNLKKSPLFHSPSLSSPLPTVDSYNTSPEDVKNANQNNSSKSFIHDKTNSQKRDKYSPSCSSESGYLNKRLKPTYLCLYCPVEFVDSKTLQLHIDSVHKPTISNGSAYSDSSPLLFCNQCPKDFSNLFDLAEHTRVHHNINNNVNAAKLMTVKSPFYPFNALSYSHLNAVDHLQASYQELQKLIIDSTLASQMFVSTHMDNASLLSHYMHQSIEYGCASCLKVFPTADELQKHLMDAHAHHLYKCSLCKLVFDSKVDIQVHFAVKHSNECTLYKCTRCPDVSFRSEVEWQLHVKCYHLGLSKPYRCLFCKDSFLTESELLVHISMHEKQFVCSICDEAFLVEYLLDKHMEIHHSNNSIASELLTATYKMSESAPSIFQTSPVVTNEDVKYSPSSSSSKRSSSPKFKKHFKCQICELKFCGESSLKRHMIQEHQLDINCNNLPTAMMETSNLLNDKSSQICVYCKQTFKSKLDLDKHMKLHHILPSNQKCNICDEIFSSSVVLAEHKLTHCKVIQSSLCTVCKVILKDEDDYFAHCHEHSSQGTNMQCTICRQTLSSALEMHLHGKHHFQVNHEFKENNGRCDLCLSVIDGKDLVSSLPIPSAKNKQMIVCSRCYKQEYTDFGQLVSSLERTNEQTLKTYQCIKCQKSFNTEYEIQLHVASHVITEGNIHECQLCVRRFDSPAKLQLHLIEHSFKDCVQMICYVCNQPFEQASDIQQHMLSSHGMSFKKYSCSLCPMKYFFSAELQNHKITHHGNDFASSSSPFFLQNSTATSKVFENDNKAETNRDLLFMTKSESTELVKENSNYFFPLKSDKIESHTYDESQNSNKGSVINKQMNSFHDLNFNSVSSENSQDHPASASYNAENSKVYKKKHHSTTLKTKNESSLNINIGSTRDVLRKQEHPCPVCGGRFQNIPDLSHHISKIHKIDDFTIHQHPTNSSDHRSTDKLNEDTKATNAAELTVSSSAIKNETSSNSKEQK